MSEQHENGSNSDYIGAGKVDPRQILESQLTGLALVDGRHHIVWCNRRFREWCVTDTPPTGQHFFLPLGRPHMEGPDFLPLSSIRETGQPSSTLLRQSTNIAGLPLRYLQMDSSPVVEGDGTWTNIIVELRDVTERIVREHKWATLREAGRSLDELSEADILHRSPRERVDILTEKILTYARDILNFASIEIRQLSTKEPGLLEPLLALGMTEEARNRVLHVSQDPGNGITGWVAYTRQPYRMDDRSEDIFFKEGSPDAKSSITSPLLFGGNLIGTFNVESDQPRAFTDDDMKLLESFAADVAQAIHTLDLLSVEQIDTTSKMIEQLHREIIPLLNEILLGAAQLWQSDFENRNEIYAAVSNILRQARGIQSVFQQHGGEIAPEFWQAVSAADCRSYPILRGRRILLVASDESIGKSATEKLFYYGCTVETATNGEDALKMASTTDYDVYMSAVKLSDMSAFVYFKRIRCIYCRKLAGGEIDPHCMPPEEDPCCLVTKTPYVPFIFMQQPLMHDAPHVATRAAQAGAVHPIHIPFLFPQLPETLKRVIEKAAQQKEEMEQQAENNA